MTPVQAALGDNSDPNESTGGDDIRVRILRGAARVFAERGVRDTTVEHILRAAGVSRRTFYKHFRDKEHTLEAMYVRSTEHLLIHTEQQLAGAGSGVETIQAAVDSFLHFVAEATSIVRLLTREALNPDSPLAAHRSACHERLITMVTRAYEREDGRACDPLVYRGLVLATEGLCLHLITGTPASRSELRQTENALRHLVQRLYD